MDDAGEFDNEFDDVQILHALNVISSVKPHQKLETCGFYVSVDTNTTFQPITRYMTGQSRTHNVTDIINVIYAAFKIIDKLLIDREMFIANDSQVSAKRSQFIAKIENHQKIERARQAIKAVLDNIGNLKETYMGDTRIVTRIEMLQNELADYLSRVEASMTFLDKKLALD